MSAIISATEAHFSDLDDQIERIHRLAVQPALDKEIHSRNARVATGFQDASDILTKLAVVIAYSQAARSKKVDILMASGAFSRAFGGFNSTEVAKMNPCNIIDDHWPALTAITKKNKAFQIVMAARAINRIEAQIIALFADTSIPRRIHSTADIEQFWVGFRKLQAKLKTHDVPFVHSTTSLLHFMLHVGFDCAKPDSAVVKAAKILGWFPKDKTPSDMDLREIVRRVQTYALERKLRPGVVDLCLLIIGGQTSASDFVDPTYYQA